MRVVLTAALALAGCTSVARVLPMNDAALAAPVTSLQFVRHGTGNGEVTVVMASGVVLQGEYQVIQNASVGFGFVGGQTATAMAFGSSPVSATAVGPDGTIMNCEAGVGGFGHGSGVCETNHGARYRVNF